MHSHDIASAILNVETAVGGVGTWKQDAPSEFSGYFEIFREVLEIFRVFIENFSKDI